MTSHICSDSLCRLHNADIKIMFEYCIINFTITQSDYYFIIINEKEIILAT